MVTQDKNAVVFGGTGFVGRYIVQALAKAGYRVIVATRAPQSAYFLKVVGEVGQIVPVGFDPKNPENLTQILNNADVVVYSIGVLFEKGKNTFARLHTELPAQIAAAATTAGVKRFVLLSALAVDTMQSNYAKTKLAGEVAVRAAFPNATILRPSVIFGREDNFFNQFAQLAKTLPFLPLIGGGESRFEPVYVGDVAHAVMASLDRPAQTFELGGAEILTFRQIYERIFSYIKHRVPLIPLPFFAANLQARFFELLPTPLLTRDQITSLQTDSVVSANAKTLASLGIIPTTIDAVVLHYLARFQTGGPFAEAA